MLELEDFIKASTLDFVKQLNQNKYSKLDGLLVNSGVEAELGVLRMGKIKETELNIIEQERKKRDVRKDDNFIDL